MHNLASLEPLINDIKAKKPGLIAIDGYLGTGKTTISLSLSEALNISCINLDSYLTPGKGSYLSSIQYNLLKSALKRRPLIVEGICVLEVLSRLGKTYDYLVYVKAPVEVINSNKEIEEEFHEYYVKWQPPVQADVCFLNETRLDTQKNTMSTDRTAIDIEYIRAKTKHALGLALGGMLSLIVGLFVLLNGIEGQDKTVVKFGNFNISAKGLGAVIMATSTIWAYFSYQSRPKYSNVQVSTKEFNPSSNLKRQREVISTTALSKGEIQEIQSNRENKNQ